MAEPKELHPWTSLLSARAGWSLPAAMRFRRRSLPGWSSLVLVTIFAALVFDFLNGFHDAANSIATVVSTRVLSPGQAVAWAAFFNFVAAFLFGTKVAKTIGTGLVDTRADRRLRGLRRAGGRDHLEHHHLVAGPADQFLPCAGRRHRRGRDCQRRVRRADHARLAADPAGDRAVAGLRVHSGIAATWWRWPGCFAACRRTRWTRLFRRLQLVSAAIYSLGHGGNDAQKTMGIIVLLLTAAGLPEWTTWGQVDVFGQDHCVRDADHPVLPLRHRHGDAVRRLADREDGRVRALPGCSRSAASVPRRPRRSPSWASRRSAACRFRRRTPSPAPSWAWAAPAGSAASAGSGASGSCMAWILTIPCSAFIGMVCYVLMHWLVEPWIG